MTVSGLRRFAEPSEALLLCLPQLGIKLRTKIRYRHDGVAAEVVADGERALVRFDDPQSAISPGQAAVFYEGDRVVGGGWIERALTENRREEMVSHGD